MRTWLLGLVVTVCAAGVLPGCNAILGNGDHDLAPDATAGDGGVVNLVDAGDARSAALDGGALDGGDASIVDASKGDASESDASELPETGTVLACSAGESRCNALQPQTCGDSGTWQSGEPNCAYVCDGGACGGMCTPTSTRCNGLQPQTCDGTGTWQNTGAACASVCNEGSCVACTPNAVRCNGLQPQTCSSGGAWADTGSMCPYLCDNPTGTCTGMCSPGSVSCNGSQPLICSSTGVVQNNGSACGTCFACSGGSCEPTTGGSCNDGNACTQTDTCQNGQCVGGNSVMCAAADNCHVAGTCSGGTCSNPLASGANCQAGQACIAWYPDCDQDGYGDRTKSPIYSCSSPTGAPACPAGFTGGYASNTGDCCDTDKNANTGQTGFFATPDACGSYDYNCDGQQELKSNGPTDCDISRSCVFNTTTQTCVGSPAPPADCNGGYTNYNTAACGATWNVDTEICSGTSIVGMCVSVGNGGPGGTQECQ
jgi:hypothetical protein